MLVNGDATPEPDETFFVNLTSADGAVIVDGQGVGTIVNDDVALPSLAINDVSLQEGANKNTTLFSFTVTLSAPSTETVTVNFATANGTATAGSDYVAKSGSVTFLPGETTKTITISVKGDKTKEADETFFVNLSGPTHGQIADGEGVGTILNDDGTSTGGKRTSSGALFDAALDDLLNSPRRKRMA